MVANDNAMSIRWGRLVVLLLWFVVGLIVLTFSISIAKYSPSVWVIVVFLTLALAVDWGLAAWEFGKWYKRPADFAVLGLMLGLLGILIAMSFGEKKEGKENVSPIVVGLTILATLLVGGLILAVA